MSNKTFEQLYREQQQLEKGLADRWGYALGSTSLDHSKQKKTRQNATPNVANITLRRFGKQINKTSKIKQVQDEIKALHNQRKLMEEQEKAVQAADRGELTELTQNKLIQWMENIVEEYNSILEHRHLIKESHFHQFTKNGLGDQESPAEKLIGDIEKKRKELKEADMTKQIAINREIAHLYKEYYKGKPKPQTTIGYYKTKTVSPEPPRSIHTLKKDRSDNTMLEAPHHKYNRTRFLSLKNSSSDLDILKSLQNKKMASSKGESPKNELRANTVLRKYKQSQYRKHYISSRQATRQQPIETELSNQFHSKSIHSKDKSSTYQKDMLSPFLDREQLLSFREMESKIRSNHEALDIWKGKVSDASSNSKTAKKLNESIRMKKIESYHQDREKEQREEQIEEIITKNVKMVSMDQSDRDAVHSKLESQGRNKEKEQEDIFSELLRKRNNKFNKLWGTKILVKYDARKQARQILLRGNSEKHPNSKVKNDQASLRKGRSLTNDKCNQTSTLPEEKVNLQAWLEEVNDNEHYQRTCKNEKINLLLKHK